MTGLGIRCDCCQENLGQGYYAYSGQAYSTGAEITTTFCSGPDVDLSDCFEVVITGFTETGCVNFNGTHILTKTSGGQCAGLQCGRWTTFLQNIPNEGFFCSLFSNVHHFDLSWNSPSGPWSLVCRAGCQSEFEYNLADASFDPVGNNTFNFSNESFSCCTVYPSTIEVNAIPCP